MEALAWIDIETTGLDPNADYLLEIGIQFTDMKLNDLGGIQAFGTLSGDSFEGIMSYLERQPIPFKMHTDNGLISALKEANDQGELYINDSYLDDELSRFIEGRMKTHGIDKIYPAGSSVHFDMSFIRELFPDTYQMFSHRHLDITSLKLAMTVASGSYPHDEDPAHRVYDDIMQSMNWFRNYIWPAEEVSTQASHLAKVMDSYVGDTE